MRSARLVYAPLAVPLGPTVLIAEHSPARSADLIVRFIRRQVYGNRRRIAHWSSACTPR